MRTDRKKFVTRRDLQELVVFSLSNTIHLKLLFDLVRVIYVHSVECIHHTSRGNEA